MDPKTLNAIVHDREAAFYDDRFLIDYDARIAKEVRRELERVMGGPVRARKALDLACGTGFLALGIAAAGLADEVHATDLSPKMIERTMRNARRIGIDVHPSLADGEVLPYADGTFDLVVARGALHHLPDPLAALQECKRVLQPGGTVVVLAEPTPKGELQVGWVIGAAVKVVEGARRLAGTEEDLERKHWELASIAANLHTFEPEQLAALAEKAGFEDITVSTAWWSWILTLGMNYYLVGEFESLARNKMVRRAARATADAAAMFDRVVSDRVIPPRWRHTVQAVLR